MSDEEEAAIKAAPAGARTLILLSGGLDSTTLVALARHRGFQPDALHVSYGQGAAGAELDASRRICRHYEIPLTHARYAGRKFSAGEILGRNAFLLGIALLEFPAEAGVVLIGVHGGTDYPDCSTSFVSQMQALFHLYTKGAIELEAPFLDFGKADLLRLARDLGVDVKVTYSCETGDEPCGSCQSCIDRARLILEMPTARA